MKQVKCFFKIQIPVCRITMQARGFAVWTTPSPRGDWNIYPLPAEKYFTRHVWTTPHREVIDPNPRYPKKISGIFLCKKLKKLACPGIDSERKSSWENLRKKFPKKLKNLLVRVYIVKGDDHMIKNFCDVPMFRWFSDIHSSRGYLHEQIFSVLCSGVPLWHVARLSLLPVCRRAWLLLWLLQIKLKKPDIPGIDSERWWSPCRYLL